MRPAVAHVGARLRPALNQNARRFAGAAPAPQAGGKGRLPFLVFMSGAGLVSAYYMFCPSAGKTAAAPVAKQALVDTNIPGLTRIYRGKVRDVYAVDDKTLLHVATDRISSFDVVMTNGVLNKGKILTQLTLWWFNHLEKTGGCPNHLITGDIDDVRMPAALRALPADQKAQYAGRVMLVHKLTMLPVEAIARGYITGSGFAEYEKTGKVCDIPMAKGLVDCQKLPTTIFTPSTKADYGSHDENISYAQAEKIVGEKDMAATRDQTIKYYERAAAHAASKGIILADTKFEFGYLDGKIVLGDEILTPDCSRFWSQAKYAPGRQQDSLDKQYVRNWLVSVNFDKKTPIALPQEVCDETMNKYLEIYKILTGEEPKL